ncbi:MAG: RNA polymerase sigma factor [Planctomycetaceae bacterium]|nr:RNA polymerase sigma factor [Planctomycetaceae bacterium]
MPLSDADILARVQRGDHELFGQLVIRYSDRFLRVAESKLGNRAAAEDVVQETFLAAFAARDSYKLDFAASTWLWTILLNLCRTRWKQRQSRPWKHTVVDQDGLTSSLVQQGPSALTKLIAEEENLLLQRLLDELPEPQADALRLRFFGGLKYEEIATATSCTLSGAKRRVKTGLQRLSERIQTLNSLAGPFAESKEETP